MAVRLFWNAQNCLNKRCFGNLQPVKLKTAQFRYQQQVREIKSLRKTKTELGSRNVCQKNTGDMLVWSRLWKPVAFTFVFTGTAFATAAIVEHERIKKRMQWFIHTRTRAVKTGNWRQAIHDYWDSLPDSKKMFISISFLNALVFLAWRIPQCQGILKQYFTATPASKTLCLPMVLSTFSHVSLWHILINMYVLHTFSTVAVPALGKEHFLALYLSAGVFSNLLSYANKIVRKNAVSSVGASGSICGIFGFIASQYPYLKFSIIFLPMFTFTATQTLYAFVAIESIACLRGLSFMDHAGHLGGVMFGVFWQSWGRENLWPLRVHVLRLWEDLHENFRISK